MLGDHWTHVPNAPQDAPRLIVFCLTLYWQYSSHIMAANAWKEQVSMK